MPSKKKTNFSVARGPSPFSLHPTAENIERCGGRRRPGRSQLSRSHMTFSNRRRPVLRYLGSRRSAYSDCDWEDCAFSGLTKMTKLPLLPYEREITISDLVSPAE